MLGVRTIGNALSSLNASLAKFNATLHGGTDGAAKTTEHIRSGASGMMTARGVKDCVVAYQCNDYICLTISGIGTAADISNHICGNIPGLKKITPGITALSVGCKYFVHLCRTGNITFSCSE